MKHIILLFLVVSALFSSVIKTEVLSVADDNKTLTIEIPKIDVGMSGFVYKMLAPKHGIIIKNAVVTAFDADTKIASLEMSDYHLLDNNALPQGRWTVSIGDSVILAFGYTRAMLIAPNEEIYHRITTSAKNLQWVHPDIFATTLSYTGHPTPLRSDFTEICNTTSVGILFFYLNEKVFTLDCKSFNILNISAAALKQESEILPFYSRLQEIDASWWGEGSDYLTDYEPHYYELMIEANKEDKELYEIVKNGDANVSALIDNFEIGDEI